MLVKQFMEILQSNIRVYAMSPDWECDDDFASICDLCLITPLIDAMYDYVILSIDVTFYDDSSLALTISKQVPDTPSATQLYDLIRLSRVPCSIVRDWTSVYDGTVKSCTLEDTYRLIITI